MRTFGSFLAVGILALAAGCGGGSNSTATKTTTNTTTNTATSTVTNTATTTPTTTATSTATTSPTTTATSTVTNTSTGTCNYPSCLTGVMTTCVPSGSCVQQTDTVTYATNTCYANGVKQITSLNAVTGSAVVTVKNGSATCYSMEIGGITATATNYTLTVKNSSGQIIATGTVDGAGSTTIACTGGQPVTIDSNCDPTGSSSSTTTCTTGTCAGDPSTSTVTATSTNTATGTGCAAAAACCTTLSSSLATACQSALTSAAGVEATCAAIVSGFQSAGYCK